VSRSFNVLRRLGEIAKNYPIVGPAAASLSRLRAGVHGGGLAYVPSAAIMDRMLADLGRTARQPIEAYVAELRADAPLRETFEMESARRKLTKYGSWDERINRLTGNIGLYYGLVRELRPTIVVETGTATGSMTSLLLAALHRNAHGKLISIDLPAVAGKLSMDIDVTESDTGYWIPQDYRDRWDYRKGDAKVLLPRVLADEKVDFFIHDSLHSTTHMAFEYATARALMPENAVIMSDDILWNPSFDAFAKLNGLRAYAPIGNPNIGALVNKFTADEHALGVGIVGAPD
jgi:predicted O-methyltransferase YrrM